jgi:hypothetical protein
MTDIAPILITIVVTVISGVILLYLEYQTGWFAPKVPKSFVQPAKPPDVGEGVSLPIANLKYGLHLLYDAPSENIVINSIGGTWFTHGREIRAHVSVYKTIMHGGLGSFEHNRDPYRHEGHYIVWTDNLGRILRTRNTRTSFKSPWWPL